MEMSGRRRIAASRETVYAALSDVAVLRRCIPGCQSIEKAGNDAVTARVRFLVGPVRVSFDGAVTLSDLDPPNGLTITGSVSGGAAGYAEGFAAVTLVADGEATSLNYMATAAIGGMVTLLGATILDRTATRLVAEFLSRFERAVTLPKEGFRRGPISTNRAPATSRPAQRLR